MRIGTVSQLSIARTHLSPPNGRAGSTIETCARTRWIGWFQASSQVVASCRVLAHTLVATMRGVPPFEASRVFRRRFHLSHAAISRVSARAIRTPPERDNRRRRTGGGGALSRSLRIWVTLRIKLRPAIPGPRLAEASLRHCAEAENGLIRGKRRYVVAAQDPRRPGESPSPPSASGSV